MEKIVSTSTCTSTGSVKKEKILQSVYNGTATREDVHVLPDTVGWVWETEQVIIGRDGSSASSNGAKVTWPNSDIVDSLCSWHASNRWFQQHTSLVKKINIYHYSRKISIYLRNFLRLI